MTTKGRPAIWEYYDRRAEEGSRTFDHALAYWTGLGVDTTVEEIQQEARKIRRLLRSMMPASRGTPLLDGPWDPLRQNL
jgi:hypothetical protein